ncbi:MAG: DUF934 domain-containing protein [Hyphomicrobiaceae bacterium]
MAEPKPLLAPLRAASSAARLWKDNRFAADDWRPVADDQEPPINGHAIVSLKRWRAEQPCLTSNGQAIGIRVEPGDTLDPAIDNLDRLGVIALSFSKFTDGRAYSTARRLREQWGFEGEIRATGDVLLDQLPLMLRSGFDALEIVNSATIVALEQRPIPAVAHTYQRSVGPDTFGWRARRLSAGRLSAAE